MRLFQLAPLCSVSIMLGGNEGSTPYWDPLPLLWWGNWRTVYFHQSGYIIASPSSALGCQGLMGESEYCLLHLRRGLEWKIKSPLHGWTYWGARCDFFPYGLTKVGFIRLDHMFSGPLSWDEQDFIYLFFLYLIALLSGLEASSLLYIERVGGKKER